MAKAAPSIASLETGSNSQARRPSCIACSFRSRPASIMPSRLRAAAKSGCLSTVFSTSLRAAVNAACAFAESPWQPAPDLCDLPRATWSVPCELLPVSKDAIDGADIAINLAQIYAWTGEKDWALEQIEAVERGPNTLSYGLLKLHPYWDALRGDPRFEKIVASLAPK